MPCVYMSAAQEKLRLYEQAETAISQQDSKSFHRFLHTIDAAGIGIRDLQAFVKDGATSDKPYTPLIVRAAKNDLPSVVESLSRREVDIEETDRSGKTALQCSGNAETTLALLRAGADVNGGLLGMSLAGSPLEMALKDGDLARARVLFEAGAMIERSWFTLAIAKSDGALFELLLRAARRQRLNLEGVLTHAVRHGSAYMVERLARLRAPLDRTSVDFRELCHELLREVWLHALSRPEVYSELASKLYILGLQLELKQLLQRLESPSLGADEGTLDLIEQLCDERMIKERRLVDSVDQGSNVSSIETVIEADGESPAAITPWSSPIVLYGSRESAHTTKLRERSDIPVSVSGSALLSDQANQERQSGGTAIRRGSRAHETSSNDGDQQNEEVRSRGAGRSEDDISDGSSRRSTSPSVISESSRFPPELPGNAYNLPPLNELTDTKLACTIDSIRGQNLNYVPSQSLLSAGHAHMLGVLQDLRTDLGERHVFRDLSRHIGQKPADSSFLTETVLFCLFHCGWNIHEKFDDRNLLHHAAIQGDILVATWLLDHGTRINELTDEAQPWSPLALAASCGNLDTVHLLISRGAKPDSDPLATLVRPLSVACRNGHRKIVEALLDASALTCHGDDYYECRTVRGSLESAVRRDSLLDAENVLSKTMFSPEFLNGVLADAVRSNSKQMVKLLLDEGADINFDSGPFCLISYSTGSHVGGPLVHAIEARRPEVVELLLSQGAWPNGFGDRSDVYENRPLVAALESGDGRIVRMLVDAGADFMPRDDEEEIMRLYRAAEETSPAEGPGSLPHKDSGVEPSFLLA